MRARYPKKYAAKLARGWTEDELRTKAPVKAYAPSISKRLKKELRRTTPLEKLGGLSPIEHHRLVKYGLTKERMAEIINDQNGVCKLCHRPFHRGRFHIDHCHKLGHVRGILCPQCNHGLGMFRDNIEVMERAIQYLRDSLKPRVPESAGTFGANILPS